MTKNSERAASSPDGGHIVERLKQTQFKSESPTEFEESVRDAFKFLGFEAELLGGPGETDVLLTANIGKESFKINVDCKTTKSGKIIDRQIDWISLRDHKKKNESDFIVVVGPDFSGGNLEERAKEYDVSLLRTEDLIRIVQAHSRFPFTLSELKDLFAGKGDRSSQLEDLLSQNGYRRYLSEQFRMILEEMSSLQDRLGYFTIDSLAGREKMEELEIDPQDIEHYTSLLKLPFINALKEIGEKKYILTIKIEDMSNIFQQISNLLVVPEKKAELLPTDVTRTGEKKLAGRKMGSKYFDWHITGRSVVARARKSAPYDHWCPIDHFETILGKIVEAFRDQELVSAGAVFSMLEGQDLSTGRRFKGKAEEYKIRMALGILEIEGLLKWTGSKTPIEYKLNLTVDKIGEWIQIKLKKGEQAKLQLGET